MPTSRRPHSEWRKGSSGSTAALTFAGHERIRVAAVEATVATGVACAGVVAFTLAAVCREEASGGANRVSRGWLARPSQRKGVFICTARNGMPPTSTKIAKSYSPFAEETRFAVGCDA